MINGHKINGAQINGSGDSVAVLSVNGTLPRLAGTIALRKTPPTGVSNGVLPKLTGQVYGGATIAGTLPRLTGTVAITAQTLLRVSGKLPKLTGEILFKVQHTLAVNGTLPALTGEVFGGAILSGSLPRLTGQVSISAETSLKVTGMLPGLRGSISFGVPTTLRVTGTLPVIRPHYGIVTGTLPRLTGTITLTAEQVRELVAYAMNIANGAMTRYTNFPFQHIVRFKGHSYGFDATGGYLLEGDTDDGDAIEAYIHLPDFDFGVTNLKSVPYVYIGSRSEQLIVSATVDEQKTVSAATSMAGRNKRAKFPRGVEGVYWGHKVANVNGGALDIDGIEILPEVKRRKV